MSQTEALSSGVLAQRPCGVGPVSMDEHSYDVTEPGVNSTEQSGDGLLVLVIYLPCFR